MTTEPDHTGPGEDTTITVWLAELDPASIEALVETIRNAREDGEADDDRVRTLLAYKEVLGD